MNKIYIYMFFVVLLIGFINWGHNQIWTQGYNAHKAEIADSKDEAETEDQKDVKTVIKWRTKTKVEYRERIKKIYLAKDPTGCADTKLTDMGFGL